MVAGSASAASAAAATAAAGTAAGTSTAGLTAGIASGPVGWLLLGAEPHSTQHHPVSDATFDCWKPVVRDDSTQLSSGKLLKEMMTDERIKEVIVDQSRNKFNLPEIRMVNIWDEQFDINYLVLPYNNQLVAHAIRVMA
jgi:hypothetical protein